MPASTSLSAHLPAGSCQREASTTSKCMLVATAIALIAGIVLAGMGGAGLLGSVGTPGFVGALAGGAALTVLSSLVLVGKACLARRRSIIRSGAAPTTPTTTATAATASTTTTTTTALRDPDAAVSGGGAAGSTRFDVYAYLRLSGNSDCIRLKNPEQGKMAFRRAMTMLGSEVAFPTSGFLPTEESMASLSGTLDKSLFHLSTTTGVQKDIPSSSRDAKRVHVYQVASQYNAAEAPRPVTPEIGKAMTASEGDNTQGPLAQRTNPDAFELVTAFLTHSGFNMLEKVLIDEGTTTYTPGSPIEHGYLRPNNTNIAWLTDQFKANYGCAEYVCYSSLRSEWGGERPVYIMLQAAPAIAMRYAFNLTVSSDELQKYAALANYLALFRHGIRLAQEKRMPVVLHAAAVGGGVFGNTTANLQLGFKQAALVCQAEMKEHGVSVQLEAYNGAGPMAEIATDLGIPEGDRLGDPSVD